MSKQVFVIRLNDGLTAPCDRNYFAASQTGRLCYSDLCGARRFTSRQSARDALIREIEPGDREKHRIESVQPMHLAYYPPRETPA